MAHSLRPAPSPIELTPHADQSPFHEGERHLRDFLKHANYLIQSADLRGRVLFANETWKRTLGYSDDDLLAGVNLRDLLTAESRAVADDVVAAAAATGLPGARTVEIQFVGKDGRRVTAHGEFDCRVVDGAPVATRGIFRDVTAQRAAEARHEAVVSVLGEGIAIISADGTLELLNPSAERVLGFRADEVRGRGLNEWGWTMLDEDGGELPREAHPALVAIHTGRPQSDAVVGVRHGVTKELVWLAVSARPLTRGHETKAFAAVVSFRDVTASRAAAQALQLRDARFRVILETVRSAAICLDVHGGVTFVNDFLLDLTGWERGEVIGANWFERFIPQDDAVTSRFQDGIAAGELPRHHEYDILTRTGERRFIRWDSTALYDDEGAVIGVASLGQDVTNERRATQLKDELIAVASHEMRTPLTTMRGALDLLRAAPSPRPERDQRLVEMAWRNAERLNRLVDDLLDVERIESGTEVLHPTVVPVAALFSAATDITRSILAGSGITLTMRRASLTLRIDGPRIEQVLTNLITNAVKFSPADSTITVSAVADGDLARLSVTDEGRGIPADKLDAVFEPFMQVDAEDGRARRGAGLGLTICRAIVHQHGGRIWAESAGAGQGTTISFTLPIAKVDKG